MDLQITANDESGTMEISLGPGTTMRVNNALTFREESLARSRNLANPTPPRRRLTPQFLISQQTFRLYAMYMACL